MGSGLSMTSVNKIKELASAREYSLALEIIESQDLTRSLNPQFIRLCGDVYIANQRYEDARKVLIMAHKMAPEAKRVIFSLTELYLKMGFKELADFYFKLYVFDAEPGAPQTEQLNYIYKKAQECSFEELETLLFPAYSNTMDYDWSYELFLLYVVQGKVNEAREIFVDYSATFKNEPNVALMQEILDNPEKAKVLFYIYPEIPVKDDDPEYEQLREEERILMEADDLRMNPKEAEIQIVFDDDEVAFGSKFKYKRFLKKQEKEARKAEGTSDESGEDVNEQTEETSKPVVTDESNVDESENTLDADGDDSEIQVNKKVNIIKKLFSKKKKDDKEELEEVESEETIDEVETVTQIENSDEIEEASDEPVVAEEVEEQEASDQIHKSSDDSMEVDTAAEYESEQENTESAENVGDSVMQEIYEKKKISISSDLGEESFLTDDSSAKDFSNPFEEMLHNNDKEQEVVKKTGFEFEEMDLSPEDDEYEVDDFTIVEVDGFGFEEGHEVDGEFEEVDESTEIQEEQISELEYEDAEETVEAYEAEEESIELEPEYEEVEETVETYEAEEESIESEPEYEETEETVEAYEAEEESVETEPEYEEVEETVEAYEAEEESIESESEYEEVEEAIETYEEDTTDDFETNNEEIELTDRAVIFSEIKEKRSIDFPVFKTNLFPEYNKEVKEVENNFNEIMTEAQDKIQANLIKEEQMQREAEALLASLGIDLSSVKPTITNNTPNNNFEMKTEQPKNDVVPLQETLPDNMVEQEPENNKEPENVYSPSRDELKSSLKIDSVKKNILKQLKEYR